MTAAYIAGFALGLSLILAIGAQNAFVLRQGLRRSHVFAVCLTCALSDAILIVLGVAGVGWLVMAVPGLVPVMTWGGAAFLTAYATFSFYRAWSGSGTLEAAETGAGSLKRAVAACLIFTWANPHVYLDTVVLLGSVSTQYADQAAFGAGAVTASFVFFFSLGYGARLLQPLFRRPGAWRFLDAAVGTVMLAIATKLVRA